MKEKKDRDYSYYLDTDLSKIDPDVDLVIDFERLKDILPRE